MDEALKAEIIESLTFLIDAYAADQEQIALEGGVGWNASHLDGDEDYKKAKAVLAKLL
jgi:hypothetical protein